MTANRKSNLLALLFFAAYMAIIVFGYHQDNRTVTVNKLASDNWSIIPMLQKQQDTTLFRQDQFLYDHRNILVFYPSHFYISLFFANLAGGDILKGYALFGEVTLIVYLIAWFLLFWYITRNAWASTLLTFLARGILWPPGKELWGAGDLMYFLPRTVFAALIPFAFILLLHGLGKKKPYLLVIGFFLIGLFGNQHPISGMGTGLACLMALAFYLLIHQASKPLSKLLQLVSAGSAFVLGLAPYLVPYVMRNLALGKQDFDKKLFRELISERISGIFTKPWNLYEHYLVPQWIVMIGGAAILSVFAYRAHKSAKSQVLFSWYFSISILLMPIVFYFTEAALNKLGFDQFNISYELMRTSKYIIIGAFLMLAYGIMAWPGEKYWAKPTFGLGMVCAFLAFCVLAKGPLKKLPVAKFDFFRAQLPDYLTRNQYLPYTFTDLDSACAWIKHNTPPEATFAGPSQIRGSALRSIPFDFKGASVLLEFNKNRYIDWALKNREFERLKTDSAKIAFYKKLHIDYLLTDMIESNTDSLAKVFGSYRLYKLIESQP